MANDEGTAVRTNRSGKVVATKRDGTPLFIRMTKEEHERFQACVLLDAELHGGEVNASVVVRRLIRAFCAATEDIGASPVAREAAKVLRKKAKV